jgi:hypothetical protein
MLGSAHKWRPRAPGRRFHEECPSGDHVQVTDESPGPSEDGLVVFDPAGHGFRIRWAKRGTQLRGGLFWWDGTPSGVLKFVLATIFEPAPESRSAYESAATSWKIGVYRLVPRPEESARLISGQRLRALVFKEKFRAVYLQRLAAGESPNRRVSELREIIEAGWLQSLSGAAT